MRWDYNVEAREQVLDVNGDYFPYGLKITKTLYDDSDQVVVKVDTTIEDARDNAGPDFVLEFFTTAQQIFVEQVYNMLDYQNNPNFTISGPSKGSVLGSQLGNALGLGMKLLNPNI